MRKKQKKLLAFLLLAFIAGAGLTGLVMVKAPLLKAFGARIQNYIEWALSRELGTQMGSVSSAVRMPDISVSKPPIIQPAEPGRPRVAIVIDDLGLNPSLTERAIKLPAAVTLSFFPYGPQIQDQVRRAREAGHEVLLHLPMEPLGQAHPGKGALMTAMKPDEIRVRLEEDLNAFSGYDGVNNHMGSKFTAEPAGMDIVMKALKERDLFFLDSRTTTRSIGERMARENGLLAASRQVFLDNDETSEAVKAQLEQTIALARREGNAIAIGHPHPAVLKALEEGLPVVENQGLALVPVRELIR